MSMKRFAKGAFRIAQQIAANMRPKNGEWVMRVASKVAARGGSAAPRAVALPRALSRNPFVRVVQGFIRSRFLMRPLSTVHHQYLNRERYRLQLKPKRLLFKKPTSPDGVIERVKDIFGTKDRYNEHLRQSTFPSRLCDYDIGSNIGYGCNAAVYSLRVKTQQQQQQKAVRTTVDNRDLKAYPLALKLMYNYEFDRISEDRLWQTMGAELAPLPSSKKLLKGRMSRFRPLPRTHPNIVHIGTAFVDTQPLLPDARERYPDALPSAAFYSMIVEEPKTLFIVMKRYRLTLRDYLLTQRRNYWTSRALLAQLLEGVVFLFEHRVAQRDMKSDNILLQYDVSGEIPSLVISDFGCALATGSFVVEYDDDTVDLGGNFATRAPEIATAKPPCRLDFSLADTWAAGTLAHEIYTRVNPFYSTLKSKTYRESEVPRLPELVPAPIRRVISDLLRREPSERILPHVAANVLSLSIFRFGADLRETLAANGIRPLSAKLRKVSERVEKTLDTTMALLAAETFLARSLASDIVSKAEMQLRATFLSRLNREDLWTALEYFDESPEATSSAGEESDA